MGKLLFFGFVLIFFLTLFYPVAMVFGETKVFGKHDPTYVLSGDSKSIVFKNSVSSDLRVLSAGGLADVSNQFSYSISVEKTSDLFSLLYFVRPNIVFSTWNPSLFDFVVTTKLKDKTDFVMFNVKRTEPYTEIVSNLDYNSSGNCKPDSKQENDCVTSFVVEKIGLHEVENVKWFFNDVNSISFDENTVLDSTHLVFRGFVRDFSPEFSNGFVAKKISINGGVVSLVLGSPQVSSGSDLKIGDTFFDTDFSDGSFFQTTTLADGNVGLNIQSGTSYYAFGDYNSGIINAGSSATWDDFNFVEPQAYKTNLPNDNFVALDINMQLNEGLWHIDDLNATNGILDKSGNDINGQIIGNVDCSQNGILGKSCIFDGVGDAVDFGNTTGTGLRPARLLTLSLWMRTFGGIDTSGSELLTMGDVYMLRINTSERITGWFFNGGWRQCNSNFDVVDGTWKHVAFVIDATTESVYVNGSLKITCSTGGNIVYNQGNNLWLGRHGNGDAGYDYNGWIDEVAVFSRALSIDEIQSIYRRGVLDLNLQVRSCNDALCDGESFVGPDGTSGTVFPDGGFNWDLNALSANQYFQYKANFFTFDVNSLIEATPKLSQVNVNYTPSGGGGWVNTAPVLDINAVDGNPDTSVFPVFRYFSDGNLTIDFNVMDIDNNRLFLDLNYSTSQTQGTGTVIVDDLNLTSTYCVDQDFNQSTGVACSIDFNVHQDLVADNNYFLIALVDDQAASGTDFNALENDFAVDNITTVVLTAVPQANRPFNSSDGNVFLTWDDLPNEVDYTLFRSTNGIDYVTVGTIAQNSVFYEDNPLSDNTLYYYLLQANGPDTNSNVAQAFTFDRTAPTSGVLTGTTNLVLDYIDLNWTAASDNNSVAGVLDYNIYRSDTNVAGSFTTVFSVFDNTLTYADTTATDTNSPNTPTTPSASVLSTTAIDVNWTSVDDNGSFYYYLIQALDEQGNDSNSNSDVNQVITGINKFYVDCVSGGTCSAANTNFDDYNANSPFGFNVVGLSPSTEYCFKVLATDGADNNSGLSAQVCATTLNPSITDLTAVPQTTQPLNSTDGNVLLTWSDVAGESDYTIFRSDNGTDYNTVITVAAGTTDFNDSTIADNTLFYYKVQANFAAGLDTNSNVAEAFTFDRTAPTSGVLSVTENFSLNYLDLNWTAATDNNSLQSVLDYNVYRSDDNITYTKLTSLFDNTLTHADTTATDTNSPNTPSISGVTVVSSSVLDVNWAIVSDRGSTFYYLVQALDEQGNDSNSNSDINTVTTGLAKFSVDCQSGGVCTVGDGGSFDDYNSGSATGLRITGLQSSTQYCFKVKAIDNVDNNSDLSTQVCGTTLDNVPDVNVNSPNGEQYISQYRFGGDTNSLVDFNVSDLDGVVSLLVDIYYSKTQNGFENSIVQDLNLLYLALNPTSDANCSGSNFGSSQQCFYDVNTVLWEDANYFIDINIFDALDFNSQDSSDLSFRIDQNKASTSWDGNHNAWQNFDANVHLTCSDVGGSECQTTRYRLDSDSSTTITYGAWQTYDVNVLFDSDGNFAIDFNSSDRANNLGDINTFYVLVDKTAPAAGNKYPAANEESAVVNQPVFAVEIVDANSGANTCRYHVFVDGSNQAPYDRFGDVNADGACSFQPVTLTEDQTAFVHFDVLTDVADNNATVDVNTGVWTYNAISNVAPEATLLTPNGVQYISQFRFGLDLNTLVSFTVSDGDGVVTLLADIYLSTDQNTFGTSIVSDLNLLYLALNPTIDANCSGSNFGTTQTCFYDINTTLFQDANFFIDLNVFDESDLNKVDSSDLSFAIDQNVANTVADYNAGWQNVDANVTFSCTDTGSSGCTTTGIRKDSDSSNSTSFGPYFTGSAIDLNAFFTIDGNWSVDFNSTDRANNIEDSNIVYVLIDKTKPSTSWDGNHDTWQNFDANIHLTCNDSLSGCNTTSYRLDVDPSNSISYGVWTSFDVNILVSSDGNFAIDFNSTDNASNEGDSNVFYVLIDKTAPAFISVFPSSDLSSETQSNPEFWVYFSDQNSLPKSCRYHVFVDDVAQAPYNRFVDVNQSGINSFCVVNVSLSADENAFIHFDVLTDNTDNNATIDQNTSYQTYAPSISATLNISASNIDVVLSQSSSDLFYLVVNNNDSSSETLVLTVTNTCDQFADVPSTMPSIAQSSFGSLPIVFNATQSGVYECSITLSRTSAPVGSISVSVSMTFLGTGSGNQGVFRSFEVVSPIEGLRIVVLRGGIVRAFVTLKNVSGKTLDSLIVSTNDSELSDYLSFNLVGGKIEPNQEGVVELFFSVPNYVLPKSINGDLEFSSGGYSVPKTVFLEVKEFSFENFFEGLVVSGFGSLVSLFYGYNWFFSVLVLPVVGVFSPALLLGGVLLFLGWFGFKRVWWVGLGLMFLGFLLVLIMFLYLFFIGG